MSYADGGPLPQWEIIQPDGPNGVTLYYEAEGEDGRIYRMWRDEGAETPGVPARKYRLAPRDDLADVTVLTQESGGLDRVLDRAGMIICRHRVHGDIEGARRQLDLD